MERSGMRVQSLGMPGNPDFASLHPGDARREATTATCFA